MGHWSEQVTQLSPEERARLEARLLKKLSSPASQSPAPEPQRPTGPRPLSFAQQSLWFAEQFQPGNAAYNIPQAMRLRGPLNVAALEKTFQKIVERHEILRTRFLCVEGEPKQMVSATATFALPVVNLKLFSPAERETEMRKAMEAEARAAFDLKNDLMLRAKLLRLDVHEHVLLLTMHHIAADLWSFPLLYREMAALYQGFAAGESAVLPMLKIQYADFAERQRQRLHGEPLKAQLDFWRQQFTGQLPILELPIAKTRPSTPSTRGAHLPVSFAQKDLDTLKQLSQREGVTLFMTLLAAFQALLYRYSGQQDIIVGSPIGGRQQTDTEPLIGYFVNTLALRGDLSGEPTFRELLQRTRQTVLGAFAHQEVPLDKIVETLRMARNGCRNPLFSVMFQFQPQPLAPLALPGLEVELLPLESGTAKFDLILTLIDSGSGLRGDLEYDTDLFDETDVKRLLQHLGRLLESVGTTPGEKMSRLPLLDPAERRRVLVEWNQTKTDYPGQKCVHELFEEQTKKTPAATALTAGRTRWSYQELNRRADELAATLRILGVGPNVLVGICMERSAELIVGLIAILKAGGAYVPLDANYPKERLSVMLADAKPRVLLTQKKFETMLPDYEGRTLFLDTPQQPAISGQAAPGKSSPSDLAYVIYTSGSTGQPKGVCVPHRAIVRLVRNTNYATFTPDDILLQFAPVSFDASTFEIWGALLNGATLVIFPPQLPSLEELGQAIRDYKISTLWLTAGLFHQMVEHQLENLRGVKQLLAGGDVLSTAHVLSALQNLPNTKLINGYGPTENTTFTTCHLIPKHWSGGRSVPIGKPISNTQVYILDEQLQPTPPGVPGELLIGGDGLAIGYLNAPELTQKKFISIQNDWTAELGSIEPLRLYRTGDKARWLADGTVEFLGRMDNQVKIRGYRIELGEIESALAQHPEVGEAVVVTRNATTGGKILVGYVTPRATASPTEAGLREFLDQKIPSFMVPSHFVVLDEFPLTANGKINRAALPEPESVNAPSREEFVAPRNSTEETLVRIWSEVLAREQIGIHDNFFQLGGHSLLATQVISRIARVLEVEFPLRVIFEAPTVAELALQLSRNQIIPQRAGEIKRELAPDRAEALLARIDQLSDAEVDALLAMQH